MVSKELSEAAVELNTILEYTSQDVIDKIPKKFLTFMKEIASTTYQFKYDTSKPLEEQSIKPKTKGLIALIYKDYLCDEQERQEYLNTVSRIMGEIEQEKRELYDPNNIFKNREQETVKEQKAYNFPVTIKEESIFTKIVSFIKRLFGKR